MAKYSLDPISDNCYPDTTVLINKFDIYDEDALEEIETVITSQKIALLEQQSFAAEFDFESYKSVHRFIFEDLYEWAGEPRTVNISKKGTIFCPHDKIAAQADAIFGYLGKNNYFRNLSRSEFILEIVDFYNNTNYLHPFREGNGRSQRVFVSQLVRNAGYDIDFADADEDLLMIATMRAAGGVNDLLIGLFNEIVK